MSRRSDPVNAPTQHLTLIGCSAHKLPHAANARDLYQGQLFKASIRYADAHDHAWAILSAKHGLVEPDRFLEPYDLRLSTHRMLQRAWARSVDLQLLECYPRLTHATLLAGAQYRTELVPLLQARGILVTAPLQKLGIGQQKAKLKRMLLLHYREVLPNV